MVFSGEMPIPRAASVIARRPSHHPLKLISVVQVGFSNRPQPLPVATRRARPSKRVQRSSSLYRALLGPEVILMPDFSPAFLKQMGNDATAIPPFFRHASLSADKPAAPTRRRKARSPARRSPGSMQDVGRLAA